MRSAIQVEQEERTQQEDIRKQHKYLQNHVSLFLCILIDRYTIYPSSEVSFPLAKKENKSTMHSRAVTSPSLSQISTVYSQTPPSIQPDLSPLLLQFHSFNIQHPFTPSPLKSQSPPFVIPLPFIQNPHLPSLKKWDSFSQRFTSCQSQPHLPPVSNSPSRPIPIPFSHSIHKSSRKQNQSPSLLRECSTSSLSP